MPKLCIVHAAGRKCTVADKGICSCIVRNLRICKAFIDCQFCRHDHIIRRSKDRIHSLCDQRTGCCNHFIVCICRFLHISDSFSVQIFLRLRNRSGGIIFGQRIQKSDFLHIRVLRQHHIQNKSGIQRVRGSGHIINSRHLRAFRIRDRRIYHRRLCLLCTGCHDLRSQRCDRNDCIYLLGNHLRTDLSQHRLVTLPGIYFIFNPDPILRRNRIQFLTDGTGDLIQRRMIHLFYNSNLIRTAICTAFSCCCRIFCIVCCFRFVCFRIFRRSCASLTGSAASGHCCHGYCCCQ